MNKIQVLVHFEAIYESFMVKLHTYEMSRMIDCENGCPAYVAIPAQEIRKEKGGIIVLQEWWGLNHQIKSMAQRISDATGCIALAPDL